MSEGVREGVTSGWHMVSVEVGVSTIRAGHTFMWCGEATSYRRDIDEASVSTLTRVANCFTPQPEIAAYLRERDGEIRELLAEGEVEFQVGEHRCTLDGELHGGVLLTADLTMVRPRTDESEGWVATLVVTTSAGAGPVEIAEVADVLGHGCDVRVGLDSVEIGDSDPFNFRVWRRQVTIEWAWPL